jgi:hypothetical protein
MFYDNRIENPVEQWSTVTLPKGTMVRQHGKTRALGRAVHVTVHSAGPGWVDTYDDRGYGRGFVILPYITYAGSGGYWVDVPLTPELCEALHVPVPALPVVPEEALDRLDTIPAYGPGYDSRYEEPRWSE